MFIERACAVRPDFEADDGDRKMIAEICDHLDCLPLAIELASARAKVLSPQAMLARLEHPLELLTAGSRDAPARHRALRDTIGWSFELLDEEERILFRRLSVFSGGCVLDAVDEVCGGDLDVLGSLVDKSLVRADRERFGMLETIREYAGEELVAATEAEEVRRSHAAHYLGLARAAANGETASDQALWRARLETEHDNLRAALRSSLDGGDAETALEIAVLLSRFWFERGYLSEGRRWLDEALAASHDATHIRAEALSGNGVLAHYQGDYERSELLCQEALELSGSLGDPKGIAEATTGIALLRRARGDHVEAGRLLEEALSLYERIGAEEGIARTLDRLAMNLVVAGDDGRARPLFQRSLALYTQLGNIHGVALGLYGLSVTRPAGAHVAARAQADESLDILRSIGDRRTFAKVLWNLAEINGEVGDAETAAAQFAESLTLFLEFGDLWFCGVVLESAAFLAARVGDAERAVRILGAADANWAAIDVPLMTRYTEPHDRVLAEARRRLREDRFATAWEEGLRLSVAATVELVAGDSRTASEVQAPDGLTPRESEVLTMVARGLTDAEVAELLVVSLRTVHAHLRSIYRKLDLHTRSAATRYALEHGLAT